MAGMHCTHPAHTEAVTALGKPRHGAPLVSLNETAVLSPKPQAAAGEQDLAGTSRARAASPAGTEPLPLLWAKRPPHKAPKSLTVVWLLTNHWGEHVGSA